MRGLVLLPTSVSIFYNLEECWPGGRELAGTLGGEASPSSGSWSEGRRTQMHCLDLFVRLGFSPAAAEAEMHSPPWSSPGLASLLTLLPAQVVAMALTSAGTHGTSAGAKAVSHLPAMERKDTRSGPVSVLGKSKSQPKQQM